MPQATRTGAALLSTPRRRVAFVASTLTLWPAGLLACGSRGSIWLALALLASAKLVLVAGHMLLSLRAFTFPWSELGGRSRSPAPAEPVLATALGGDVGPLRASSWAMTWTAYPSGLAFSSTFGEGFVAYQAVTRVDVTMFGGRLVEHRSPEVRSPLLLPSELAGFVDAAWEAADSPGVVAHQQAP